MNIHRAVAVVTGASGGIGRAVATELARRGAEAIALVDLTEQVEQVAGSLNELLGRPVAMPMVGDLTDDSFRQTVFDLIVARHGTPSICVPAPTETLDQVTIRVDRETGCAAIYPVARFRHALEVNLVAPVYWALETIARLAEQRKTLGLGRWEPGEGVKGTVVFIGSAASPAASGRIADATANAGLDGVETTLTREALEHGVRCAVVHPDFSHAPLIRALGDEFVTRNVLPYVQSSRLNDPSEVANAVCASIASSGPGAAPWPESPWRRFDAAWPQPT
jgi:NAD(P)-dependent dehydrogenase (short-subunit alcohol dehydrogenase family)